MLVLIQMGTNMSLSFATKAWIYSLEKLKNIKIILSNAWTVWIAKFAEIGLLHNNSLSRHVSSVSHKSLGMQCSLSQNEEPIRSVHLYECNSF